MVSLVLKRLRSGPRKQLNGRDTGPDDSTIFLALRNEAQRRFERAFPFFLLGDYYPMNANGKKYQGGGLDSEAAGMPNRRRLRLPSSAVDLARAIHGNGMTGVQYATLDHRAMRRTRGNLPRSRAEAEVFLGRASSSYVAALYLELRCTALHCFVNKKNSYDIAGQI